MSRRHRMLAALAVVCSAALAGPAAAQIPVGPARTVAAPACETAGAPRSADAAFGGGQVRAFTSHTGRGCGGAITFSTGGSQGWQRSSTPYRGVVLSVAADEVAAYLLYVTWNAEGRPTGLGVTKRTHAGHFFPTTVLSSTAGTGAVATTGDVAARGGRWWAVWAQQVGPGGEFAQQELFQAGTALAPGRAGRVTTTPAAVDDSEPSIALDAAGAVLAWTRHDRPAVPGPSDVWVAVSRSGVWERARAFSTAGTDNSDPDVTRVGAVTALAFFRDGRIVEADNSTGRFREHVFLVRGSEPRVGVSARLFVAWTAGTETDASSRVLLASASKGGAYWDSAYVSGFGQSLLAMVAVHQRATVLVRGSRTVYSRTGG